YYSSPFDFNLKIGVREFLVNHGINLMDEGYDIRFRNQKAKLGKGKGKVNVKVTSGIDWFDINANYITEEGEIKNFNITKDVIKDGLVQIGDNYIILSKEDIAKLSELLKEGMDHNGKLKISKLNFGVIDSLYDSISNNDLDELKFAKEISGKLKKFKEIEKNDLPQKFNGKLREYQEAGYNWLHFLRKYNLNGCLADDMGLGKTVQTLAFLQKLKETGSFGLSLLVVPVTTVANWESEINRFAPEIKFLRHLGQERVKDKEIFKDYDLVISSYHTLRNDIEFFNDFEFDYLILDEAQNIKNHSSLIFKTVRIIKAKRKLSLTGTPIENNTTELWSQFNFLNPSLLGGINEFKHKFVNPIEVYKDPEAADRLRKTIYPFILRRKKEEVAKDLPEKEEIIIFCEMSKEQKKFYEKLREYYKSQIGDTLEEKGVEKSAIQIFEALLRLRQAALFPSLVSEEYKNIESVKFETLKDLMEEIVEEKHKALLFSQFVQSLKIIEKEVKDKKIKYSYIDGQTKKRDVEIKRFQEDEDTKLFLLSLKAGGVGINLTAADYVILFDPWWNPAAESQAVDRSHRIGQTRKVMVYKLIVKDTVEEKILELQNKKTRLFGN
ncbi:MAG TPA: DEAD/DEAH box helicase, partial [Spirochaetota bacterium]|nr:DEAD/DEAH box helicase [Spirochaetota bacterium]